MIDRLRDRRSGRRACRPQLEGLEGRQLLAASINPIPNVTAVQTLGLQVPVQGGPGAPDQTYTVTTDNSNVIASVTHGKFMTINVTHTSSGGTDPTFSGALTFQLFDDLTPLTTSRIEQLVEQGFYTSKTFHRVANNFPTATDFIVQGGSVNGDGTGNVNQPGFPFQDEFQLPLAFTGSGQLAMANAGRDTNDSQFFITTGQPRFLDFLHTIFGQLVEGQSILTQMTQVSRNASDKPINPITMTSVTLSDTSPDTVIHINSGASTVGNVTNVTVTATDPATHTTASRTFQVNVVANNQNERAILAVVNPNPITGPDQAFTLQLNGSDAEASDTLTYTVQGGVTTDPTTGAQTFSPVQNATASVSTTGLVTVTPNAGFVGDIPLLVGVRDQVDRSGTGQIETPSNYDYHLITLTVTPQAAGVREIGKVLVITPPPRTDKGSNDIAIAEANGSLIVDINGVISPIQPMVSNIDRIVVFGATANDNITIAPSVDSTLPVTLDGGHGGLNVLQAGNGSTREHGWFGHNVLIGGPADDALIGQMGRVRFVKSGGNDLLFAGVLPRHRNGRIIPPGGTFYKFVGNKLVPISVDAGQKQESTTSSSALRAQSNRTGSHASDLTSSKPIATAASKSTTHRAQPARKSSHAPGI